MKHPLLCLALSCAGLIGLTSTDARAATYTNGTATASFLVSLTILPGCTVTATPMAFLAVQGSATGPVTSTSTLVVACTASTGYNIGLNAGTTANSTDANRLLAGAATGNTTTVPFGLFQDPQHAKLWGNTQGSTTYSDTGTGAAITYTVYGQATLNATMPQPDTYSSTVTATVYF